MTIALGKGLARTAVFITVAGLALASSFPSAAAPGRLLPRQLSSRQIARLASVGPDRVAYRLPGGQRMIVSREGATIAPAGAGGWLLVLGSVKVRNQTFGIVIQALTALGAGPQDGLLLVNLGIANGPLRRIAFQDHAYEMDSLGTPWVHLRPDLSRGWMSTGDALGPWGSIHLTFTPNGPPVTRCNGRSDLQKADVKGHVRFTPQGDNGYFGTIASIHVVRANMRVFRGQGCRGGGGGYGPFPCPIQPFLVDGNNLGDNEFVDFFGSGLRGGHRALVAVNYQQWVGDVSILHEIFGLVPAGAVQLTRGPGAKLEGIAHAYMSGGARFTSSGPPESDGPHKCGRGRFFTANLYNGALSSTPGSPLTALFVTGAVQVPEAPESYQGFLDKVRITG